MTDFDETFDFVVAGSGGGSLCAGLYLRSQGKRVLILEKTEFVGGTTAISGGVMWIPDNPFLKRDGVQDSYKQAAAYLDSVVGNHDDTPGASPERRHTFLVEGPRMIDFLLGQGIEFTRVRYWPDYYDERPGGSEAGRNVVAKLFDINQLGPWAEKIRPGFGLAPIPIEEMLELPKLRHAWQPRSLMLRLRIMARNTLASLTGKRLVSAGVALQARMLQAALREGVEIRTEAPVQELIFENGSVKGVLTVREGQSWRVGARLGVLVNAGGFAHNQRMREQYQPGTSSAWSTAAPGDTGEMIEAMMRLGAAVAQMDEMIGQQTTLVPVDQGGEFKKSNAQALTASPHVILVDQTGVRYMNEGGSYMAYCQGMLERNKAVPAVPSWAVFDDHYFQQYSLAGTKPGGSKPRSWSDTGYLKSADTIEELALKLGMEPEVLKRTIDRFNGCVANNRDDDFGRGRRAYDRWLGDWYRKPSETLGSIDRSPFYAVPVVPGDCGTFGGVVTDEHARVLREDGTIIPGLYATGVSTASVMGRSYPGPGASVAASFVWGYVAAKHAAGTDGGAA